jgi:hypothetical protein
MEKDRLIEKFMGWELTQHKGRWVFVNGNIIKDNTYYNDSVLGYTTDWNLLMDALKKFDNLIIPDEPFDNFIKYRDICDSIDFAVSLYNIDDAVNALCEGITWYNSTIN